MSAEVKRVVESTQTNNCSRKAYLVLRGQMEEMVLESGPPRGAGTSQSDHPKGAGSMEEALS